MQLSCCHPDAWRTPASDAAACRLAEARRTQLELALRGEVLASAAYAAKAQTLRQTLPARTGRPACPAAPLS